MRVVLDINVLASALIATGKPKELWLKAVRREYDLLSSKEILSDFLQVISRQKFERYVKERDIVDFLEAFNNVTELVNVKSKFRVVKQDPDDDIILAAGYYGKADYIVSGDKHLLDLIQFRGIRIVTVDKMLKILARRKKG